MSKHAVIQGYKNTGVLKCKLGTTPFRSAPSPGWGLFHHPAKGDACLRFCGARTRVFGLSDWGLLPDAHGSRALPKTLVARICRGCLWEFPCALLYRFLGAVLGSHDNHRREAALPFLYSCILVCLLPNEMPASRRLMSAACWRVSAIACQWVGSRKLDGVPLRVVQPISKQGGARASGQPQNGGGVAIPVFVYSCILVFLHSCMLAH